MRIWSLLAGFLLLCASAFAQEGYIDTPVSTTQVTATNIVASRVSATTYVGNGSGLLITTSGTTTAFTLADIPSSPINVAQLGAQCDGAQHSGNLTAAHLAAAMAAGNPMKTVIDLPDNCVWGTNTTNGLETPIVLQDNTMLRVFGRQKMAVNNSTTQGLIVTKAGYSDGDTVSATAVEVVGMPGNSLDTVSRTDLAVSWKMVVLGNCNRCSVRGLNISTTTFLGSFAIQGRNPTDITIADNTLNMIPSPDGRAGGDGIHLTGNVNGALIFNNKGRSVDDFISLTDENSTMANKIIKAVRIIANKGASYAFSGLKLFTGNGATGSLIEDIFIDQNHFSVWGPKGVDGNCIKIQQEDGLIKDVRFGTNICDDTNGNGVAVLLTAFNPGGVDNVDLGRLTVKNYPSRGIEIDGNVNNTKTNGAIVGPTIATPTVIVTSTGVAGILRSGANTAIVYLTSGTSLSSVSANTTHYITLTGMGYNYNNWTGLITAKDVTNSTVTISSVGVSTSTNETGANGSATIVDRGSGVAIYDRGSYNTRFDDLTIIDPPSIGYQWTTYNGTTYQSTTVPGISYYSQDTAKLTISTTTTNLAQESPYSGYVSTVSFTNSINNLTNAKIISVSTVGKYLLVNVPGITSATNESNTSATVTTLYLPTNGSVNNSKIISQTASFGLSIQAGQGIALRNNRCIDFAGNVCAGDSNSTNVSGTVAIGNADEGMNRRTHQSFNFQDAQYDEIYLNKGTNSDWFSKVRDLGLISASTIQAVSATINTSLTVGGNATFSSGLLSAVNISATGGVSITGSITAGGTISATQFVGGGGSLTGIVATASPGGATGQLQWNNAGTTSGTAAVTYNGSTGEISTTGNFIGSNGVSGSKVMGTNAGTCSANTIQVQAANNGLYRPGSNQLGICAGGTESIRVFANAVSLSTAPLHLASPTTIPACDATNKGNIYMNTTTNCLVYCNGTSVTTIGSAGSGCS